MDPLDEGGRGPAGADALLVALQDLDGTCHLRLDGPEDLAAHAGVPPAMRAPTCSPLADRHTLSGWLRSKTMIGRSFSMHSETSVASRTASRSVRTSANVSSVYRRASGWVSG